MRTKRIPLEKLPGILVSQPGPGGEDGPPAVPAARVLQAAIQEELTPRQRQCVELYYYQRLTMEQIGGELGIGKATVCRHLQKSKARLARALAYSGLRALP